MNALRNNEIKLKLLKLLEVNPTLTQREMNKKMGVSLGKINYCLAGLIEKGLIRVERFKQTNNKRVYIYRLTPNGFEEMAMLTLDFLKLRIQEYDQIKKEIKLLSDQINRFDIQSIEKTDLIIEAQKRT